MAKNWAFVIGINKYDRLRWLNYAERDAELMRDFFKKEAEFEEVFYFSDKSPEITAPDGSTQSTQPTFANLWSFLHDFFEESFMEAGDNFWFYFSGHGIREGQRDYLIPSDGNTRAVQRTAILVSEVTGRLRQCGADNVILLLDACRNEGAKADFGIGDERHQGVITISSCSPKEKSYEIEEIGQGSFTYALLEALRIQGESNCATVERLDRYLRRRVPEINRQYQKPPQTPYTIAEPATKLNLILLPQQANQSDIAMLRDDAKDAELEKDFELAEQLWTRILDVSPNDPTVLKALKRIWTQRGDTVPSSPQIITSEAGARSSAFEPPTEAAPQQNDSAAELGSEQGINSTQLRNLLASGKRRETNQETHSKLNSLVNQLAENEKKMKACRNASRWVAYKAESWAKEAKELALAKFPDLLDSSEKVEFFHQTIYNSFQWLRKSLAVGHSKVLFNKFVDHSAIDIDRAFIYRIALNNLKDNLDTSGLLKKDAYYLKKFFYRLINKF